MKEDQPATGKKEDFKLKPCFTLNQAVKNAFHRMNIEWKLKKHMQQA